MKVIEEKPWSCVFECRGCGSKLEAEAGDVRVGHTEFYVTCMVRDHPQDPLGQGHP